MSLYKKCLICLCVSVGRFPTWKGEKKKKEKNFGIFHSVRNEIFSRLFLMGRMGDASLPFSGLLFPGAGYHELYNGVVCNDTILATGVFSSKELWMLSKGTAINK